MLSCILYAPLISLDVSLSCPICYGYYISVSSDAIVVDQPDFVRKWWRLLIVDRYNLKLNVGDPGEVALVLLSRSRSNLNVMWNRSGSRERGSRKKGKREGKAAARSMCN